MVVPAEGEAVVGERQALDLLGDASYRGASWVALPVERLGVEFFRLRSGVAGAVVQKFAQYRTGLAVVGDVAGHVAGSDALRDFVRESNRGLQLWFVADLAELGGRLSEPGVIRGS
ncbi:DUF4180 domain-containing protein [Kitasatospora sp. NA04385]|uniref:DUF4180 domain-containing protein n=1 Tax=Kitasatospora sp. NA04385 TaxID=2742135 RepID=UPI0015928925|nr:DUF4180 domain-containing protein [Kitasatospora sp. NA04385]QKW24176.1 DUF4180 domain-containing protein [Kitasatospora sp. NA04385]